MSNGETGASPRVAIIMGSKSDWSTMQRTAAVLSELKISHEAKVVSAHRTPDLLFDYVAGAEARGIQVIIAGAGGAAHLPGMAAAKTSLPVLGVPVQSRALQGLDSLLSIVLSPVVMVNLLGRLWENGEPAWDALFEHTGARLHLYGKDQTGPSRKMGHFLIMQPDTAHARSLAMQIMRKLERRKRSKVADTTRFQCS